jgi:Reverse transcriptase (RNA-dependent DNA polymerase)
MRHIESELSSVQGSSHFCTFDLSHGYWQLELAAGSRECQSFITPEGVFTPTRALHGTSNAVLHMQAAVQGILNPLSEQLVAWLDDLLLHATADSLMLAHLRTFFTLCREYNLKLHPGKCTLFADLVRWCGRLVSGIGVRFDPRRIQGLLQMSAPQTGADLQQFLCALDWMRTAIPSFAELVPPLQKLLELAYQKCGGRHTKTAVAKVSLKQI